MAFFVVWAAAALVGVAVGVLSGPGAGGLAGLLCVALGLAATDKIMRQSGGIPCLTWHSVSASPDWLPWAAETSLKPETLDRQLAQLKRMGLEAIDSRSFAQLRQSGHAIPENAVMLHFDDGYLDNWIAAAPLLEKHGFKATMFISLDFIAPDRPLPETIDPSSTGPVGADFPGRWDGYLSWREIRALDQGAFGGCFDIQPHGVDHGRVPTSPRVVDTLTAANWRKLSWMQWARMPGDKHDWYMHAVPPALPLGTDVPESESALAARAWHPEKGTETQAEFEARIAADFQACFERFQSELGKVPSVFCWPQNRTTNAARSVAAKAGFTITTAGTGSNRREEDPTILSRVHVGERYAGFESRLIDDLAFRATIRAFQGNQYWYLVLLPINGLKKLIKLLPDREATVIKGPSIEGLAR